MPVPAATFGSDLWKALDSSLGASPARAPSASPRQRSPSTAKATTSIGADKGLGPSRPIPLPKNTPVPPGAVAYVDLNRPVEVPEKNLWVQLLACIDKRGQVVGYLAKGPISLSTNRLGAPDMERGKLYPLKAQGKWLLNEDHAAAQAMAMIRFGGITSALPHAHVPIQAPVVFNGPTTVTRGVMPPREPLKVDDMNLQQRFNYAIDCALAHARQHGKQEAIEALQRLKASLPQIIAGLGALAAANLLGVGALADVLMIIGFARPVLEEMAEILKPIVFPAMVKSKYDPEALKYALVDSGKRLVRFTLNASMSAALLLLFRQFGEACRTRVAEHLRRTAPGSSRPVNLARDRSVQTIEAQAAREKLGASRSQSQPAQSPGRVLKQPPKRMTVTSGRQANLPRLRKPARGVNLTVAKQPQRETHALLPIKHKMTPEGADPHMSFREVVAANDAVLGMTSREIDALAGTPAGNALVPTLRIEIYMRHYRKWQKLGSSPIEKQRVIKLRDALNRLNPLENRRLAKNPPPRSPIVQPPSTSSAQLLIQVPRQKVRTDSVIPPTNGPVNAPLKDLPDTVEQNGLILPASVVQDGVIQLPPDTRLGSASPIARSRRYGRDGLLYLPKRIPFLTPGKPNFIKPDEPIYWNVEGPNVPTLVLTDLHGNTHLLRSLMRGVQKWIESRFGDYELVVNGDLINKGPNGFGAVQFVADSIAQMGADKVVVNQGNHEESYLEPLLKPQNEQPVDRRYIEHVISMRQKGFDLTLDSYRRARPDVPVPKVLSDSPVPPDLSKIIKAHPDNFELTEEYKKAVEWFEAYQKYVLDVFPESHKDLLSNGNLYHQPLGSQYLISHAPPNPRPVQLDLSNPWGQKSADFLWPRLGQYDIAHYAEGIFGNVLNVTGHNMVDRIVASPEGGLLAFDISGYTQAQLAALIMVKNMLYVAIYKHGEGLRILPITEAIEQGLVDTVVTKRTTIPNYRLRK
ncbi:Calcineurin-like phosphoesterase [Noviherbaspirillum humi]|uniref:Calcineurin-like phosphoesterase n=1 Tax=Noviherbaspirillum humi TaxID=1688639 RepID=A0A239KPU0_9BURK|nr:metallophosphoesterase [Noviherbaspirillum humi]SNT19643.1 Calcineurin-like phosphoesterase [Noviherbaspirillum humi]